MNGKFFTNKMITDKQKRYKFKTIKIVLSMKIHMGTPKMNTIKHSVQVMLPFT